MTDSVETKPTRRGHSKRAERPARIDIGDDVLVRNDIIANQEGVSERTLNRGDKKGDPFTYVGGVKYRPEKAHRAFRASRIQRLGQAPLQRRRHARRSDAAGKAVRG